MTEEEEYYDAQRYGGINYENPPPEPDVVPCFECGTQMYEITNNPRWNLCEKCFKKYKELINLRK